MENPVRYSNSTLAVPPPVTGAYISPLMVFSSMEWRKGVGSSSSSKDSKMVRSPKDSFIIATIFTGRVTLSSPSTLGYWSFSSKTSS